MAKMKDALDETLAHDQFVNKGSGLPKPEDIEKYEAAVNAGQVKVPGEAIPLPEKDEDGNVIPPEPEKKEEPKKEETSTEPTTEVEKLDALQKKIEAKEK